MDRFRRAAWAAVLAGGLTLAPVAFAANVAQDAQALIDAGKADAALGKLNDHLAKNPQDAEARFTKGLALVKLGRSKDAIRVFADLTRDYPQLPEPYNNLAVLYAAQGDYEKARDALQAAVAKHPSYATAHENLGDIYAALAGAAYGKAAALDSGNPGARRKLAVINQLDTGYDLAAAPQPVAAAPVSAAPAPAAVAPMPAAAKPVAAPEPPQSAESSARHEAALAQVAAWAKAWASKDLDTYFSLYAPEFTPEGGISRASWEAQRRDRIGKPQHIAVRVINPQASDIEDGAVRVGFRQAYESDSFSDTVNKVIELIPADGTWKIVREYTR
ncbi:L,D-transpeptidase Cds6 family protein [Solimonas variicoloris]|uniref:L,D-transpeptidase Cds6 family protein n=1 Tax=Solimonas variicoloris TaxID=254408 RepID=UPI00036C5FCB|nr:tetratricopeptide repeat protein [Solimonas variicoloris]